MDEIVKEYLEIVGSLKEYINYQKMCGVDYCQAKDANKEDKGYIDMEETLSREMHNVKAIDAAVSDTDGNKRATIDTLKEKLTSCNKCKLAKNRTKLVFGEGNIDSKIVFIGEAPGRDEDESGRPFVGRAGKLLTKIIEAIGFQREEVYIMNIVKCRPPENRNPENDEISACEPFMLRQIEIIKPKIICTLGSFASQTLLKTKVPISKLRGQFHDYHGIKLMPTFHPAFLLRDPHKKREVWEDMKIIIQEYEKS